ncbi:MAG: hypothetical protein ACOCP4_04130 [Candidatus Woesearchaeota archaeon]
MARFDQYIGLNDKAKDLLIYLKNNYKYVQIGCVLVREEDTFYNCGDIRGEFIRIFPEDSNITEFYDIFEEIQYTIWSGGPMYFTSLKICQKKLSKQYLNLGYYYAWSRVPGFLFNGNTREFDISKGEIYI